MRCSVGALVTSRTYEAPGTYSVDYVGDVLTVVADSVHILAQLLVLSIIDDHHQFHVAGPGVGIVRASNHLIRSFKLDRSVSLR